MSFNNLISEFAKNNKIFLNLLTTKNALKKIKKYNVDLLNESIKAENGNSSKIKLFMVDKSYSTTFNTPIIKKVDKLFPEGFIYESNQVTITEDLFIYNFHFGKDSKLFNDLYLKIIFKKEDIQLELFKKEKINSKYTPSILPTDLENIKLINDSVSKYNINIYKIVLGDSDYIKELNVIYDQILLESDNNILKELINNTDLVGSLNLNSYIIEKNKYNIIKSIHNKIKWYRDKNSFAIRITIFFGALAFAIIAFFLICFFSGYYSS